MTLHDERFFVPEVLSELGNIRSCSKKQKVCFSNSVNMNEYPVVDVTKVPTAVLCYAVCLTPYAASGGVKLTCVITTLDGFLRP